MCVYTRVSLEPDWRAQCIRGLLKSSWELKVLPLWSRGLSFRTPTLALFIFFFQRKWSRAPVAYDLFSWSINLHPWQPARSVSLNQGENWLSVAPPLICHTPNSGERKHYWSFSWGASDRGSNSTYCLWSSEFNVYFRNRACLPSQTINELSYFFFHMSGKSNLLYGLPMLVSIVYCLLSRL